MFFQPSKTGFCTKTLSFLIPKVRKTSGREMVWAGNWEVVGSPGVPASALKWGGLCRAAMISVSLGGGPWFQVKAVLGCRQMSEGCSQLPTIIGISLWWQTKVKGKRGEKMMRW